MQRRLTFIDIVLDKSVRHRYLLAKVLYYSFTHDMRLAKHPEIPYHPRDSEDQIKKELAIYKEQGIYYQSLIDTMADNLIATESDNSFRIISFRDRIIRTPFSENVINCC